jgi:hypothetical protein
MPFLGSFQVVVTDPYRRKTANLSVGQFESAGVGRHSFVQSIKKASVLRGPMRPM